MKPTLYVTCGRDWIKGYMPADLSYLFPASSWAQGANWKPERGLKGVKVPAHITDTAADCGGYVATKRWGDYRYTAEQYTEWLHSFTPKWAATMDYCCEEDIAGTGDLVRRRQEMTTDHACRFWGMRRESPWCWIPTVQGWHPAEYERHAEQLKPLVMQMQEYYRSVGRDGFRVGVGTLCQRKDSRQIREIAHTVADVLPGVPLHLWGVKGTIFGESDALPETVTSCDSAAWTWSSNTLRKGSGLTQREYAFTEMLPGYVGQFEARSETPKQVYMRF